MQVEKYGGRIAYEPDQSSAGSPAAAPATPTTATGRAPGHAAGTSNGVPAGNAGANAEGSGLGQAESAHARAGGSDAAAAPPTPDQAPGRSQSPGPSQAASLGQAPGRAAGQHVVAFEQRDQVDQADALRAGDPVEFLLLPGGPGRRPHATQVRLWSLLRSQGAVVELVIINAAGWVVSGARGTYVSIHAVGFVHCLLLGGCLHAWQSVSCIS